jgi:glucokinase
VSAPRRPVLGIDVGGTTFTALLCEADGRVTAAADRTMPLSLAPAAAMTTVASAARELAERAGLEPAHLGGAGLAVPGNVDVSRGILRMAPNLPGWRDVPVGAIVAAALGVPAAVEHDVRMAALGEARLGAGRGVGRFVCVTVGTGVGAAIVLDGRLYRGATDAAGEIGHVPVPGDGAACGCGRRGCLETVASGRAIAARAREAGATVATAADVFAAAAAGDPACARVIADAVAALAAGLTILVNVLNPDVIAVGGGVAEAGAAFLDPLRVAVRRSAWTPAAEAVRIVPVELGPRAGAIGAALHVAEAHRAC